MRCPDCNKFVSYGEQEPEIENEEMDGNELTVSVRVVLPCGECGTELKDASMDVWAEVDHDCPMADDEDTEHGFTIDSTSAEFTERRVTTDAKGKTIPFRYQKQYYGAEVTVDVTCNACDETFTVTGSAEEQASGFNELV